jgi:hypothetical protein
MEEIGGVVKEGRGGACLGEAKGARMTRAPEREA